MPTPQFLTLPGWQNSGSGHWQTLWEQRFGDGRVEQHDWDAPLRGDWITRLEDVVLAGASQTAMLLNSEQQTTYSRRQTDDLTQKIERTNIILVAHSLGCHLVAAWAAVSPSVARVRGALLVAPPDVERADWPGVLHSWRKPALQALPFKATCVLSTNDPFGSLAAGRALAAAWGAQCVELGAAGHINAGSGLGEWPAGRAMLLDLTG